MNSRVRVSILVVVAVGIGLGAWLVFMLFDGDEPALQGKDELVGGLTPGRVLYVKYEEYIAERITPCGPKHPQMVIGESWEEVEVDGLFSGVAVSRSPDGQLLAYMEITSGEVEYTDELKRWWQTLFESQQDTVTARVELLEEYVLVADALYDEHLEELRKEGLLE